MSEVKKIATRDSYGNALVELGKEHENLIVLDADLAGATKTCIFQKEFPERHWDCGIAECNMTGIAAGLSTCGKVPFISSFAMFAAGRNYEQVRNSIGYPHPPMIRTVRFFFSSCSRSATELYLLSRFSSVFSVRC